METQPKHDKAVVFACDEGHLPFAFFAARRIMKVEPAANFDIVICLPDISKVPVGMYNMGVLFRQIDVSALPEVEMPKEWIKSSAYYRWLLPDLLASDYSCLFYLDTDTYLARPGIQKLFDETVFPVPLSAAIDFQMLGAVEDGGVERFTQKVADLGGGSGSYYNSGVWLCHPEEFAKIGGWERFREAAITCQRNFQHYRDTDQDAMNLAFAKQILPLNPLYNWRSMAWRHDREVQRYDPYILHFAGPTKPWRKNDNPFTSKLLDEYVDGLREFWPDFAPDAVPGSMAWRKQNPKHRLGLAEYLRNRLYLRRFHRRLQKHQDANLTTKFDRMDEAIKNSVVGS